MATNSRLEKRGNTKYCEKCKKKIYKEEDFYRVSLVTPSTGRVGNVLSNYHIRCVIKRKNNGKTKL